MWITLRENMVNDELENEKLVEAINNLTKKMSDLLLKEFLKLPESMQKSIVLIKSAQLMLANILCQVAINKEELEKILQDQGNDVIELTHNCAMSAYSEKFSFHKQ